VQAALDANPGSSNLRTDQSCSSLNRERRVRQWLDNTSDPDARIDC
jgi:hypothetical protein